MMVLVSVQWLGHYKATLDLNTSTSGVPSLEGIDGSWGPTKKLRFQEHLKIKEIPVEGKGYKHRTKTRAFEVCYLDAEGCPPPNAQDLNKIQQSHNGSRAVGQLRVLHA